MTTAGLVTPFLFYAFASSITPGPNNAMLAASGANYGLRPTIPHTLGVVVGFATVQILACLGVMNFMEAAPRAGLILKVVCVAYLLYLAVKIATADPVAADAQGKPLGFWSAVMFQFVNPKGVIMAITAASAFPLVPGSVLVNALAVALVFTVVNLPCATAWAVFGTGIGRLLRRPRVRSVFNLGMGGLVAASGLLVLI